MSEITPAQLANLLKVAGAFDDDDNRLTVEPESSGRCFLRYTAHPHDGWYADERTTITVDHDTLRLRVKDASLEDDIGDDTVELQICPEPFFAMAVPKKTLDADLLKSRRWNFLVRLLPAHADDKRPWFEVFWCQEKLSWREVNSDHVINPRDVRQWRPIFNLTEALNDA